MSPMVLIIDGMDKVGKTTLIKYINKITNYEHLIIDRGPIGYKAYSEIYEKKIGPGYYIPLEAQFMSVEHLCIYLHSSEDVLKKRFIDSNEPDTKLGIKKELKLFNAFYECSGLNKISICTDNITLDEMWAAIKKKIADGYTII